MVGVGKRQKWMGEARLREGSKMLCYMTGENPVS